MKTQLLRAILRAMEQKINLKEHFKISRNNYRVFGLVIDMFQTKKANAFGDSEIGKFDKKSLQF